MFVGNHDKMFSNAQNGAVHLFPHFLVFQSRHQDMDATNKAETNTADGMTRTHAVSGLSQGV